MAYLIVEEITMESAPTDSAALDIITTSVDVTLVELENGNA